MIKTLPIDLMLVMILFVTSIILGLKLFNLTKFKFDTEFNSIFFSLAVGLQIISYFVLSVTLLNFVYSPVFIGFLGLIIILCFSELKYLITKLPILKTKILQFNPGGRFELVLCSITGIAIISNFFFNYSPPTQVREMMYDLSIPKLYLLHFPVEKQYTKYYSYHYFYFMHFQMIYTMLLSLFKSGISFKLFNYFIGILNLILIYKFTKKISTGKIAVLAGTIYYLMPLVTQNSGTANIEFGLVFYGILSLWSIYNWSITKDNKWFYIAVIMAGFCFTVKMPGFGTGMTVFLVSTYFLIFKFKEKISAILRNWIIFILLFTGSISPWIIRNYIITGNPVYPFMILNLNGAEDLLVEKQSFQVYRTKFGISDYVKSHVKFHSGDIDQSAGPIIFTFIFISLFLINKFSSNQKKLFIFAGINFFCLYFLLPLPFLRFEFRYYLLPYSLFAIITAITLTELKIMFNNSKVINTLIIFSLLFPCLFMSLFFGVKRIPVMFNLHFNKDSYIQNKITEYKMIQYGNANLAQNSRIVTLHFILNAQYYWNYRVYKIPFSMMYRYNPEQMVTEFRKKNMTHVYYSMNPNARSEIFNIQFYTVFNNYCKTHLQLVHTANDFYLYKI